MKTDKLISIIVPSYNVEPYLCRCVDSILQQTYINLEVILVDDGSTDETWRICDEYAQKDPRVRVIHKKNGGQSSARNAALDIFTGDMVAFVDSDDFVHREMVAAMARIMEQTGAEIVTCEPKNVTESTEIIDEAPSDSASVFDRDSALTELLTGGKITNSVWGKLYSRTVIEGLHFLEGMIMEDLEFVHKPLSRAEKVAVCPDQFYYYYIRENSTMHSSFSEKNFDSIRASKMRVEYISEHYPKMLDLALNSYVWCVLYLLWWSDHAEKHKFDDLRKRYADEMLAYIKIHPEIKVSKAYKFKIMLLRTGLRNYDRVWDAYHKVMKMIGR